MAKIQKIRSYVLKTLRVFLLVFGVFFLLIVILAFTSLPFWARYNLGKSEAFVPKNTQTILVMGGGGFPSESVLMRLWYSEELAKQFPGSKVIIATPGDTLDPQSTVCQMEAHLVASGVRTERIIIESEGLNTRYQALRAREFFQKGLFREPLVVVSSPEHIYRTVLSFEKVGFKQVSGRPAMEAMLETDLKLKNKKLGGNENIPDVGNSISIRYKFWDYLKYEIIVAREYFAIAYYKVKGWI
ncbi:MAG TPA: YdcF family protein [Prolixibacteraceae bacterium]|nr:YdcF family protein [Prolixibacteraceae bacterium]HPS12933.1 YdcF family protein [Prolixibacteraceae bacterium]